MRFESSYIETPEAPEINLTPLIDVVFLLLIFFMVSTRLDSAKQSGISIALPQTGSTSAAPPMGDLTVSISPEGQIHFEDGRTASIEEFFVEAKKTVLTRGKEARLVLRADTEASHGTVVSVMDKAREAGVSRFAVATESANKKTPLSDTKNRSTK